MNCDELGLRFSQTNFQKDFRAPCEMKNRNAGGSVTTPSLLRLLTLLWLTVADMAN
jgi:hypothetical protein